MLLLVPPRPQCTAPVGSTFYLWAGNAEPFSSNEFGDKAQPNLDQSLQASVLQARCAGNHRHFTLHIWH